MALTVLSWNVLAHPHTRHNSKFHGQPGTESIAQRDSRYAANLAILLASGASVLCLQEADKAFVASLEPHYRLLIHAVNGSGEGCAILVLAAALRELAPARTFELSLGAGKSVVGVELLAATTTAVPDSSRKALWVVSLHLSGGPGEGPLRAREAQLSSICETLAGFAGLRDDSGGGEASRALTSPLNVPALLCGDWNDSRPERLAAVSAAGLQLLPLPGPTGLSGDFSSAVCIDWVAATGTGTAAMQPSCDLLSLQASQLLADSDAAASTSAAAAAGPKTSPSWTLSIRHFPSDPWAAGAPLGSDHVPLFVAARPGSE